MSLSILIYFQIEKNKSRNDESNVIKQTGFDWNRPQHL